MYGPCIMCMYIYVYIYILYIMYTRTYMYGTKSILVQNLFYVMSCYVNVVSNVLLCHILSYCILLYHVMLCYICIIFFPLF